MYSFKNKRILINKLQNFTQTMQISRKLLSFTIAQLVSMSTIIE